jgi:hypothetical protein
MYVVVNEAGQFYTGNYSKVKGTYPFLWTPYRQQAKRYHKQGWAQQVAHRWRGQVQAHLAAGIAKGGVGLWQA